jgi:hypothetical protein
MRFFIRSNELHVYEVRPRKDHCCIDLTSDALLFTTLSTIKPSYKNHKHYNGRPSDHESNGVSNVFAHFIFRFILASSILCVHSRRLRHSQGTSSPPLTFTAKLMTNMPQNRSESGRAFHRWHDNQMRLCFSLRPLKSSVVSIGYALKSTSFNEQASHVFHGPRLASGRRFLSSAFKECLCFSHSFSSVEACRMPVFGAAPPRSGVPS